MGGGALPADADLLFLVDVLGHAIGVVALKQLSLLPVEEDQCGLGMGNLAFGDGNEAVEAAVNDLADPLAARLGELNGGVIAANSVLKTSYPVIGLRAATELTTAADEVVVGPTPAPAVAGEHQAATALAAVHRALQVVAMSAVTLARQELGRKLLLHPLKQRQ
ncbi:MAG TPA: hypothetical protein VJT75_11835 [Thermoleophilaceae bacterium]|nr:hypothetical protein [Thermoleophilaceae bacterium]